MGPSEATANYDADRGLTRTVARLLPLYSPAEQDRPDSLLGDYPNTLRIAEALEILIDTMFPGKLSPGSIDPEDLDIFLLRRLSHAWRLLRPDIARAIPFRWLGAAARTADLQARVDARRESARVLELFMEALPGVRELLIEDVRAAYYGDPAALTFAEVQLAYPGLLAIASHRLAHVLCRLDVPVVPRIMSEWTHARTGVDINPGARIGHGFFIDHATGVVIGETSHIGNHVKIYQGVTLGAKSFPLDEHGQPIKRIKRHPTVEDRVIIYANATILGGDTVIGAGSIIGGNVFLTESVPPESYVVNGETSLRIRSAAEAKG